MKVVPECDGFGKPYTSDTIEVPGPGPTGPATMMSPARVGPKRYCAQATLPGVAGRVVVRTTICTRGSEGTWSNVSTHSSVPSLSRSAIRGGHQAVESAGARLSRASTGYPLRIVPL